jgi:serine/threonine protein kinase
MSMPVAIGETLAGKYRIERVLGEGGMGVVVAATHLQLEQLVAIKFLLAAAVKNEELVTRFAREARVLAKLDGEHVGRVIDVGQTDDGSPYMVMEYLDGRDLEKELEARGALPIAEAVDYVLQAIEAIAEAHNHGIVHRDLKPANLFLARKTNGGTSVKVLDFGISKNTKEDVRESGLTKASAVMGSPLYMSPEQLSRASDADQRSDVWSLGVILYELTTTKLPFDGDSMPQLLTAVLHGKPTALLTARRRGSPPSSSAASRRIRRAATRTSPGWRALSGRTAIRARRCRSSVSTRRSPSRFRRACGRRRRSRRGSRRSASRWTSRAWGASRGTRRSPRRPRAPWRRRSWRGKRRR